MFGHKMLRYQLALLNDKIDAVRRRVGYVPFPYDISYASVDEQLRTLCNDVEAIIEHLGLERVAQTVTPPHLKKKTRRASRR